VPVTPSLVSLLQPFSPAGHPAAGAAERATTF